MKTPLSFLTKIPWRALVPAWLVLISGGWAADGLKGEVLFENWPLFAAHPWLGALVAVLVFMATSIWLYANRQAFSLIRSLSRHLCEARESLILLVSPPNILPAQQDNLFPLELVQNDQTVQLAGDSLADDIKRLDALRWNWQQLFRAILPHAQGGKLKRLHLIGSHGPHGSFGHLGLCQDILTKYLPDVNIVPFAQAVNFEDFNELVQCMRQIIADEQERGMHVEDIVIDVTGGFKTASIAGASITFNSKVTFQYVQTQPPFEVYAYDVVYQPPEG